MKTLIIIFSYKYPYEPPTEQFLNEEMPYWVNKDSHLLVCPLSRYISKNKIFDTFEDKKIEVKELKRHGLLYEGILGIKSILKHKNNIFCELKSLKKLQNRVERNNSFKIILKTYLQAGAMAHEICDLFKDMDFNNYDKIILYSYWLNSSALAMCLFRQYLLETGVKNVKAISRAHGDTDLYLNGISEIRPGISYLKNLDCIYSISQSGYDYLKKQGLNNVFVSRLGIKQPQETGTHNHGNFLVVSCSVVNDNKRVDKIAKAISLVGKKIKLTWVHFGDGPNYEKLKDWCKKEMPSSVTWMLNGWTNNNELLEYYMTQSPDLFINASLVEGIPVSIMEAFSYSIPAIATKVGATQEIVYDNKNGFLIDKYFRDDELASLILQYIEMPEERKANIKKTAFLTWEQEYSACNNFTKYVSDILQMK